MILDFMEIIINYGEFECMPVMGEPNWNCQFTFNSIHS